MLAGVQQRVRCLEPSHIAAVVSRSEVVEAGFGVAFFAGELKVISAVIGRDREFVSVGEAVRFVQNMAELIGDYAGGTEVVGEVILRARRRVYSRNAFSVEEHVIHHLIAIQVGLGKRAGSPVEGSSPG